MSKKYVVTGGGGFVGLALIKTLRKEGHEVVSIARGNYPILDELGAHVVRADISSDKSGWSSCFEGAAGVFHTAAKVEMWGKPSEFFAVNVIGTRNIKDACIQYKVPNLVFTSSPSVIANGTDLCGVDESYPYPEKYTALYPQTKAQAEREILSADNKLGLRTVSLRPHLIFGPGDTNFIPTILERAQSGKLRRVGDGKNLIDLTYIDDCVNAHILAMRALENQPESVGGKAYFITQGDPVNMWDWINQLLEKFGVKTIQQTISYKAAKTIAQIGEAICGALLKIGVVKEPPLTRFLVCEMATSHYFNLGAAKRDFGFEPSCTVSEAMGKF